MCRPPAGARCPPPASLIAALLLLLMGSGRAAAEYVRTFEVSEGVAVGTVVGRIGESDAAERLPPPPYLIVPKPGSSVDADLAIDQNTGEIRTKVVLDREVRSAYSLVAIPFSGDSIRVVLRVLDENDNAPAFPAPFMHIEFPENTPRDVKRTLQPARDLDLGVYNTQRYSIVSGNVNNAFRLSSHRERDGVLYLDLQINGFLDRETTPSYSLVVEALDGGSPPLRGVMTVNVTIQDVNDNQPIFNQSRYFATVAENATIGTSVLRVFATDTDAAENGRVSYSINRRQSDRESMFRIDAESGEVAVNRPLDFEAKEVHELVVVARDNGEQPLETTAFVSIRVTDVNDNQPTINVIFLSDDATPKISENAQPGEFVARISVNDPDSKEEYANVNVTLEGGEGRFGLATRDNIIYLVIVSLPLDRERTPDYTLSVVATDQGSPPLHAARTFQLRVTDVNDNAPEFDRAVYHAHVLEVADPGTSVFRVTAVDRDEGDNSAVTYSIREAGESHASAWFQVDADTGLITTRAPVDCETEPVPKVVVVATDSGRPPLSSSATVLVTIHDVNDNEPIFDQSFYNVSVAESETVGHCILKVSATDPDCGVNAMVNYTLGEGGAKVRDFEVKSSTGDICVAGRLDFETRSMYEFPIVATDRGGLSTTAMLKIQLTDVNDNLPTFYPREYNVSLREEQPLSSPVVVVAATDPDSGSFGALSYAIVAGNDAGLFRVDPRSGEIFVVRPPSRTRPLHHLNVSATDGAGLRALADAEVFVSVVDSRRRPPVFEKPRYDLSAREDAPRSTVIGSVRATSTGNGVVRYSIYSGDPNGYFTIDPVSGAIRTASELDHEAYQSVLLNVQAMSGDPPSYGHCQVNVVIHDVNDNAPHFDSPTVRISVPENVELGAALYAAHASDPDGADNGSVRYALPVNPGRVFAVDSRRGTLSLARHLDYERATRHALVVTASDLGTPPLASNLSVLVEVQDVNDNPPAFERAEYSASVPESLAANSQVAVVAATDADTGNNARLTYRLLPSEDAGVDDVFGIFPNSGAVYLRQPLDRERRTRYALRVLAMDNGTPAGSATASLLVTVTDVNDNPPAFSLAAYEFTVEENRGAGAVVGVVRARDPDEGPNAALRYSLSPGNETASSSFHLDPSSGTLVTREPLDRESRPVHTLWAEARDGGDPPRSARVPLRVIVTDVNDNSPQFAEPGEEEVLGVREQLPPGAEVARVRATDADEGNNASITYSILKGKDESEGSAAAAFDIDPSSGVIRTRVPLEHAERALYRLAVAASDGGRPPRTSVRLLRVQVLDLEDERPAFASSSLTLKVVEGVAVGHVVGRVGAAQGGVAYALAPSAAPFAVNRTSGALFTTAPLDREATSEYRLEVRVLHPAAAPTPGAAPLTTVVRLRVELQDANDNAPIFAQDPVVVAVAEDVPPGAAVWNFSATDADAGANGQVKYSIAQQSPREAFTIDADSGALRVAMPLDFEAVAEYTVVVSASDMAPNASNRLSSSITARVLVEDINDNWPEFTAPIAGGASERHLRRLSLRGDEAVGATLTHVIAVDRDSRDNGRVSYALLAAADGDSLFRLEPDTGRLWLARPLTDASGSGLRRRTSPRRFLLNVTASDHGLTPLVSSRLLEVVVEDGRESPPRFQQAVYEANVTEGLPPGAMVVRVSAADGAGGGNGSTGGLRFEIPPGVAGGAFVVGATDGVVRTTRALDRETEPYFALPVYVAREPPDRSVADSATLFVRVLDVNDNAPEFHGSCRPLSVPENSDLAVIRAVVATDADDGRNGELTYSITGGNVGNKFSIDLHSGELSARPLDREASARYALTIAATDGGGMQASCTLLVSVEDQNDNDPRFAQPRYSATVAENAAAETRVLRVEASDADAGLNARLVYSLANESSWLFRIDNRTGVITTAGLLDREKQRVYNFQVVATDGGLYDARSQRVPVSITVTDVNDNKPIFTKYPFTAEVPAYTQPGQFLLRVSAEDLDEGPNADIVYSFVNEPPSSKFRIAANTGIVTAASSLAMESGKLFHLEVLARDKGNPPLSATGLVEIRVGEAAASATPLAPPAGSLESLAALRFHNSTYRVRLSENALAGKDVVQVSAVRTDGRRQRITYSFGSGNEDNTFEINSNNGLVRVRDPRNLDFEASPRLRLTVVAQADGLSPTLYAYASVWVELTDQNDNAPRFTQGLYFASVWEGNNKGTFVMQVSASDADQGSNAHVIYHIVDGNHDNAFVIEPPFSGIVKTNIVLDREIRDAYRLTIIATDEGVPQLTGTSTLRINIVDVNDNQPAFPPHSTVSVTEGAVEGSVVTAVTANDVDTNPALMYSFAEGGNPENAFFIDRFSGQVAVAKPLDRESRKSYLLRVQASDSAHVAVTSLTVMVTDENDNAPVFDRVAYEVALPELTKSATSVIRVNASDADSGESAKIRYSLSGGSTRGFRMDELTGVLKANRSLVSLDTPDVHLVVKATDSGRPPLSTVAALRIHVSDVGSSTPRFAQEEYRVHVREDVQRGSTIHQLMPSESENGNMELTITNGNEDGCFYILSPTGELILLRDLDRETVDMYTLRVVARDKGSASRNASAVVVVQVDDVNDNAPTFAQAHYEATVGEGAAPGASILRLSASDVDAGSNAALLFDFSSGNDQDLFSLDPSSGVLSLRRRLDFESRSEHRLVVRVTDRASPPDRPLSSIATVRIAVEDENDNEPRFPLPRYVASIAENEPVGTSVLWAVASDADAGPFGVLSYAITEGDGRGRFRVDPQSGLLSSAAVFDYEARDRYSLTLRAADAGGRAATALVTVEVDSRDEYPPEFTERTYHFAAPAAARLGHVIGHVRAVDRDRGPDGRVVYQLASQHPYFKVNRTTGAIMLKKKLSAGVGPDSDVSLVVTASSGRPQSLTNMTVVEISVDGAGAGANLAAAAAGASPGGLADWALGLLVALVVLVLALGAAFLALHVRHRRRRRLAGKPSISAEPFAPPAFDIRAGGPPPPSAAASAASAAAAAAMAQFPPKYDEIPAYEAAAAAERRGERRGPHHRHPGGAASELSEQSQSASSGRGSAEDDVEDEEIRMINEGIQQREASVQAAASAQAAAAASAQAAAASAQAPQRLGRAAQRLGLPDCHGGAPDDDNLSDVSVHNTQEYLARLGIDSREDALLLKADDLLPSPHALRLFEEEEDGPGAELDISTLIYAKLSDVGAGGAGDEGSAASGGGGRGFGFDEGQHPSMTGSLSSIVHSEEELTGSYNWDYLLDWGPQYQPLAHVFSEIARLKDDAAPKGGGAAAQGAFAKKAPAPAAPPVPPLLTSVAPRSLAPVALTTVRSSHHQLPRSPISHEASGAAAGGFAAAALSPSFSPSLSPLATRSPSISPMVAPGVVGGAGPHHGRAAVKCAGKDSELRI